MIDINAEEFYDMIVELGEKITFKRDTTSSNKDWQADGISLFASISPNRSNKAIATTEGSYLYTGVMTFDNMAQQENLVGSYFKRTTQPNSTCMLYSIFPENSTEKVGIVSVFECNEKIDIISHYETTEETDKYGKKKKTPVYAYQDVDAYVTSFNKSSKDSSVGSIDKTLNYLILPAAYLLSTENTILRTGIVFNRETKRNEIAKIPYKIESTDTTMMDIVDGKPVGTIKCMIVEAQKQ